MGACSKCGVEMKENKKYCKSCGTQAVLDDKKARVLDNGKSWLKPAIIAAVAVLTAAGGWMYNESKAGSDMNGELMFSPNRSGSTGLATAVPVTAENGEVRIPAKNVEDGNAHFFAYKAGAKTISFFVMKAADGSMRTAFDACVACNHAKLGYRQEGKAVVCNNCGMGYSPGDIGKVTGGCNPIPLQKITDGQVIVLKTKDLEAGAQYF